MKDRLRDQRLRDFIVLIDRQMSLDVAAPKEAVLFGVLAGEKNSSALEDSIETSRQHFENSLSSDMYKDDSIPAAAVENLVQAGKIRENLEEKVKAFKTRADLLSGEIDRVLKAAPSLKVATDNVAYVMQERNAPSQYVQEAKKQRELADRFTITAAAYFAQGGEERRVEIEDALKTYGQVLYKFSNDSDMQATIMALVGTNQKEWRDYQDALSKALEIRKSTIADIVMIANECDKMNEAYFAAKEAIGRAEYSSITDFMRYILLISAAFLAGVLLTCFFDGSHKAPSD
jgi:hypothetical protein